jgi:hypothetical protein
VGDLTLLAVQIMFYKHGRWEIFLAWLRGGGGGTRKYLLINLRSRPFRLFLLIALEHSEVNSFLKMLVIIIIHILDLPYLSSPFLLVFKNSRGGKLLLIAKIVIYSGSLF